MSKKKLEQARTLDQIAKDLAAKKAKKEAAKKRKFAKAIKNKFKAISKKSREELQKNHQDSNKGIGDDGGLI